MQSPEMNDAHAAVLITGAASGIGAALARRLAAPGISMALHGGGSTPESGARLETVVADCKQAGARCLVTRGNLAEPGHGAPIVAEALDAFGRLDKVVHCAGHVDKTPIGELNRAGLDRSISLMPGALLEIATAALPALAASGVGRIVAVSSFIAHKIEPKTLAPASAIAKAAMETLVRCLALSFASQGITVNAVVPGFTRKDAGKAGTLSAQGWIEAAARTPTGRLNEADEVAAAIEFLLSAPARQITGALLHVDGGLTLG
ncbi:SDR family NAD(P)-dependent oxidoreductase [Bosea sp. NBC_00550]|uniref:SDR family NAD(P)-dependent oxidoreductase n=1 Tax=Bosea sp. NBC_00550 TaxID=2969621 RepID=UPI0029FEFE12|nr:SDR family oxidoreductase [Bosea sp. NBC_00550]